MPGHIIIITGPTASGKTAFVDQIYSKNSAIEVINADMGQFYAPLSIGTAKPDWRALPYLCHLFDILTTPEDFTVVQFRARVIELVEQILARGNTPVIVGGSMFYIKSLFYPPLKKVDGCSVGDVTQANPAHPELVEGPSVSEILTPDLENLSTQDLWERLQEIDPVRAAAIHPSDRYRIGRALEIWYKQGVKPSSLLPVLEYPFGNASVEIMYIRPSMAVLTERINARTAAMVIGGWGEEAQSLRGTSWAAFVRRKNLIGYTELVDAIPKVVKRATEELVPAHPAGCRWEPIEGHMREPDLQQAIRTIEIGTRQYAKRQILFLNKFMTDLQRDTQAQGFVVDELVAPNKVTLKLGVGV